MPASEPVDESIIAEAAAVLRRGRLVVIPTDTVYGLAADFANADAVAMLQRIKRRPGGKPIPLLVSGRVETKRLNARFGKTGESLARRFWPGPLTLVLPTEQGWEGFRVPDHGIALAIIAAAGGLLRVTSANLSGEKNALTAADAIRELREGVSLAIDSGTASGGIPSTVVKVENEQAIILREGAISRKDIYEVCHQTNKTS